MYLTDGVTAMVWGPRHATFVLALGNAALDAAIQEQVAHGDTRRKVLLPYGVEPQGRALHAWIVPESSEAVWRFDNEFFFQTALAEITRSKEHTPSTGPT